MKVALVSSAWPPVRCGVGDYTAQLADALEGAGVEVIRFGQQARQWDTLASFEVRSQLLALQPDIIHVQYPSTGYRRSLLPALLPLLGSRPPVVVTLHEFSIFRFYRWPWFAPFAYAAAACVFTSAVERDVFVRRMPRMRARRAVIPIGSNVPRGAPTLRDPRSVCYFGLVMPGKGVEAFLDLAESLHGKPGGWRAILIGAVAVGSEAYARGIVDRAASLQVAVHIGLPAVDVANLLQGISYAYLPGPGGITERRGAVLAALENGVQVVGPLGEGAPDWLRARVWPARSPAQAVDQLAQPNGRLVPNAETQAPSSVRWDAIAQQHKALYDKISSQVLQDA